MDLLFGVRFLLPSILDENQKKKYGKSWYCERSQTRAQILIRLSMYKFVPSSRVNSAWLRT